MWVMTRPHTHTLPTDLTEGRSQILVLYTFPQVYSLFKRSSERSQCAANNISHKSVSQRIMSLVSLSLGVRRRGTLRGKGQVASLHVTSVHSHVLEQQSWKGLHKLFKVPCAYSQLSYKVEIGPDVTSVVTGLRIGDLVPSVENYSAARDPAVRPQTS